MKKTLLVTLTALSIGVGLTGAAYAKDGYKHGKGYNPVERMAEMLELDQDQISELETLYAAHREERKEMHEQFQAQLDSILTAEQRETKSEMMKKHQSMKGHHMGKKGDGNYSHQGNKDCGS